MKLPICATEAHLPSLSTVPRRLRIGIVVLKDEAKKGSSDRRKELMCIYRHEKSSHSGVVVEKESVGDQER